jgi:hypothetical protein
MTGKRRSVQRRDCGGSNRDPAVGDIFTPRQDEGVILKPRHDIGEIGTRPVFAGL